MIPTRIVFLVVFILFVALAAAGALIMMRRAKRGSMTATGRLGMVVAADTMAPHMNSRAPYSTPAVGVWQN